MNPNLDTQFYDEVALGETNNGMAVTESTLELGHLSLAEGNREYEARVGDKGVSFKRTN